MNSCRKRALGKGNGKSEGPEVGRGLVLLQDESVGVLECKEPGRRQRRSRELVGAGHCPGVV